MQNKGAIKLLTIALAIACAYQLSFTFVSRRVERRALEASGGNPAVEQSYLDSIKSEVVYNLLLVKYTYSEVKDKEINLGLDLKGGMNVMLEVSVQDILVALSDHNPDPKFNEALALAKEWQKNSTDDYITLFAKAFNQVAPGERLSDIFSTYDLKNYITSESTNDQVIRVLREQSQGAITNSYNVLRSRIDRFGVTQPNIQPLERSGRILVELPGVKEPERVRKLLQGTASLEFWATYDNTELFGALGQINKLLADLKAEGYFTTEAETVQTETPPSAETASADSAAIAENQLFAGLEGLADTASVANTGEAEFAKQYPLFALLSPAVNPQTGQPFGGPVIGHSMPYDTARVNAIFAMPQVRALLPRDVRLHWGVKPAAGTNVYELYAIKANTKDGRAPLDGGAIVDARGEYAQHGAAANVSMVMNPEGARIWQRLTADNIGRSVAIVLDGYVYSAPRVQVEISGGRSEITGNFTINEATDLANVLKSGKLPAPARIIQEAVVGPTLGQESINASVMSFILAFFLVMAYMIFFYNTAGFTASLALIANLFFLFGVLASFGAVLTLPGIAGIVLTMGMAVDANVIIYERIKEELKAGKGLSLSIADGYKNAYSAIIDGNVTTLITGIILFIFGTGPVQGFATTLIIGILTSLFTSIFITRMIFVWMLQKNWKIRFSNRFTENFLANTKIDFIGARKVSYVIVGVMFLVSIISFATRGMSYGVDFSGGRAYVVRFDRPVTANEVRAALDPIFTGGLEVKQYGSDNQHQMRIVTQYRYEDEGAEVETEIGNMLFIALGPLYEQPLTEAEFLTTAQNPNGIISSDKVGASVAHDIKVGSLIAVLFSLIAIGTYIAIRFRRWQWALGSVFSLAHDAFMTIGIFSLLHGVLPFNLDVDQSFIAAILTIIGYSINDKVVIFDRIREYNVLYPKRDMRTNINGAINTTLSRTVNTSMTTLVVLLAIFFFGGVVIRGFIFALMFGVTISIFSTAFLATPIAYDFMEKARKKAK